MTELILSFMIYLDSYGLCRGYYCSLYLFAVPGIIVLLFLFKKRRLLGSVRKRKSFGHITWQQMELLSRQYYEERGFKVRQEGGNKADGGIDLDARKGKRRALVQVKHYKGKVGVKVVREMLGVLLDEKKFNEVHIVSSSSFTKPALELAKRQGVYLIDGKKLLKA